jgi:adenylate kinase
MSAILVGGTPGTGKTEVATKLGSILKRKVIPLGKLAEDSDCVSFQDTKRDTGVINEDCLVDAIMELVDTNSEDLIIEGHYIDLVPSSSVEHVFILRTHPRKLKDRLNSRDYSPDKVSENIEAEVMGVCQMDAIYSFGEESVTEIDTSDMNSEETAKMIVSLLETPDTSLRIDWLSLLEQEGVLDEFLPE